MKIKLLISAILIMCFTFLAPQISCAQISIFNKNTVFSSARDFLDGKNEAEDIKPFDIEAPPEINPFKPNLPRKIEKPKPKQEVKKANANIIKPIKPQKPSIIKPVQPRNIPVTRKPKFNRPSRTRKPPTLNISGVVWNTDRPQAIINDKVIGVGDTISDSVVKDITKTSVIILYGDKEFTIKYEN